MKDMIPKKTGNSRLMRSAIPAGTTWADALALLRAGTFPFDLAGLNTDGIQQDGTPLNTATLLDGNVAQQLGVETPSEALGVLAEQDAALDVRTTELEGRATHVPLIDVTTTAAVAQISVNIGNLDLTGYHHLEARFYAPSRLNAGFIYLRTNGISSDYYHIPDNANYTSSSVITAYAAYCDLRTSIQLEMLVEMPLYTTEHSVFILSKTVSYYTDQRLNRDAACFCPVTYGNLRTFDFVSEMTLPVGSRVQVWGVT